MENSPLNALGDFQFQEITSSDVAKAIKSLSSSASVSVDGIKVSELKTSCDEIISTLAYIFNQSLTTGTYPARWKTALITPIHKKGSKYDTNNYRPISLLSNVSKVFEKIIDQQIRLHLTELNALGPSQQGFLKGKLCQSALLTLSRKLFFNRDERYYSALVSLDFTRVFNTINHQLLLDKLAALGLATKCRDWFHSYLLDTQQSVVYGGICSDTQPIKTGVPQGSILGPLLFLIYINGLLTKVSYENSLAYADDIMLVCHNKDASLAISELQNLVNIVDSWSRSNCLQMNLNKSMWMLIYPMLRKLKSPARCTDSTQISVANT